MEQKTCTLRICDKPSGRIGALFFQEGDLLDARLGEAQGETAAYEILSWDSVSLAIQNECAVREKRIAKELSSLLIEAARRQDERKAAALAPSPAEDELARLRRKTEEALGPGGAVAEWRWDDTWNECLASLSREGQRLGFGPLAVGFVDRGEAQSYILCPRGRTIVLTVNPKCPRDRIFKLIGE
jgi:hypothetical protein